MCSAASGLGLHCLPMSKKWDARLIWVNLSQSLGFYNNNVYLSAAASEEKMSGRTGMMEHGVRLDKELTMTTTNIAHDRQIENDVLHEEAINEKYDSIRVMVSTKVIHVYCLGKYQSPAKLALFITYIIRILHVCEMLLENSTWESLFGITRLWRMMQNSHPKGRNFLSAPSTHLILFLAYILVLNVLF